MTKAGQMGITFTDENEISACILVSGTLVAQTPPELKKGYKKRILSLYRSILVGGLDFSSELIPEG